MNKRNLRNATLTMNGKDSKWVIITGGYGLIGSNLVKNLLKTTSFNLIIIDDLSSGRVENINNMTSQITQKNRIISIINKVENINIKSIKSHTNNVDYIFHFASRASPKDFYDYPIEIMMTNSVGTKNMLDIAVEYKAKFILASTSEVYGDPLVHPQDEEYRGNVSPIGIRSCYDESKRFSEALVDAYQRKFNLKTIILRIFNTYGKELRINDGRVIPNFISNALKGDPLIINGDGSQTRSFCHVKDLIEVIIKIMTVDQAYGEVFNIGNPEEISINNLAQLVISITSSKSTIIFNEIDIFDPKKRLPSIKKIRKYVDWQPKISLEKGLTEIIKYLKSS